MLTCLLHSLQSAISRPGTFWFYGGFALLGAIWLALTMPETAGRSLEQIQMSFSVPRNMARVAPQNGQHLNGA